MAFIEHLCTGTENKNLEDISGTCVEKKEEKEKKPEKEYSNSNESASKMKVERSSLSTGNTSKYIDEISE
jgi:hypothetical protein